MEIKLPNTHSQKSHVGNNKVSVSDEKCLDRKCFSPHNWSYRRTDGKIINDFRCNTREHQGCPEV